MYVDPTGMAAFWPVGIETFIEVMTVVFRAAAVIYNEERNGGSWKEGQHAVATIMWYQLKSNGGTFSSLMKLLDSNEFNKPNVAYLLSTIEIDKFANAFLLAAKLTCAAYGLEPLTGLDKWVPKAGMEGFTQNRSTTHFDANYNISTKELQDPYSVNGQRKADVWLVENYVRIGDNVYFKGIYQKTINL